MSDSADVLECEAQSQAPDWTKAETLYMSNIPNAEIVEQCGVSLLNLRKRIVRYGWHDKRQQTRQAVSQEANKIVTVVTQTKLTDQSLHNSSNTLRNALGKRFELYVPLLSSAAAPKSLKSLKAECDSLKSLIDNGRVVFGWDSTGASTMISVTNLESARPPTPVTDVSAVVVPEQSMLSDSPEQGKAG